MRVLTCVAAADPSTQVGAWYGQCAEVVMRVQVAVALTWQCGRVAGSIVSPEKKIVGIGYNGFPNGCSDDELPWARSSVNGSPLDTKYPVRLALAVELQLVVVPSV